MTKIKYNIYTITVFMTVVVFLSIVSCAKKEVNKVDKVFDPEVTPSMITDSVTTLISDSGITRYKLIADTWHIFDRAKEPYWFFPSGLYLERFDEDLAIEATIESDTAWNYTKKKLWRLKGNVEITNMAGDEFKSEELFWDQDSAKVYSNEYIEIKQGDLELKGYGFESNEQMTKYRIFRPHDGKYPFEERPDSSRNNNESIAIENDSLLLQKDTIE